MKAYSRWDAWKFRLYTRWCCWPLAYILGGVWVLSQGLLWKLTPAFFFVNRNLRKGEPGGDGL